MVKQSKNLERRTESWSACLSLWTDLPSPGPQFLYLQNKGVGLDDFWSPLPVDTHHNWANMFGLMSLSLCARRGCGSHFKTLLRGGKATGTQARMDKLPPYPTSLGMRGVVFREAGLLCSLPGGRALSISSFFTGSDTKMECRGSDTFKIKNPLLTPSWALSCHGTYLWLPSLPPGVFQPWDPDAISVEELTVDKVQLARWLSFKQAFAFSFLFH